MPEQDLQAGDACLLSQVEGRREMTDESLLLKVKMLGVSRFTAQTQTSGLRTSGSIDKLRATGLLPILVHSSVDANSTALLGNMRISGTVF